LVVYADIVFLENLIINYVILYVTTLVKKIKVSNLKILVSSACGSIYTIVSIGNDNAISKLILSIIMIRIILPTNNFKKILETLAIFYLISFTTGGTAIALSYFARSNQMNLIDGIPVIEFPILVSSVGVAIGIFLIWFTLKNVKQRISKRDIIYDMEIFFGDRRIKIKALLDTGNMLKDPLTQKSVVVATKRCLKKILPEELFMDMETILGGDRIGKIKEFEKLIKIIPFKSLGNEHGILLGIKSNKIIVDNSEIKDVIIGIYEKEFSKTRRYDALIGIDLLCEEECNYEFNRKVKK